MSKYPFAVPALVAIVAATSPAVAQDAKASDPPVEKKKDTAFEAGAALGLIIGTSGLGLGPGVGVDLGSRFRLGGGALAVHLRTQYQQASTDGTVEARCATPQTAPCMQAGSMDYSMTERALDFGLRVSYRVLAIEERWTPYFGLGPKLYLVRATTTSLGLENSETDTRFGFVAFGGAQLNIGPGHAFGELEFQRAGLRHRITGDSSLSGVGLIFGYRLAL
ncbi:MAG: outer membrane beta-barrel protein [Deltaproteobacteria bacterium]|nr:outer membrane beta-barrel protein [Deltaproteobacteria bacterium]